MKRRVGILLGITAVSVLAVAGLFAGIAAQENDESDGKRSFAERVASILGLETDAVEDAFAQAKGEIADERQDAYLAKLVEDGTLTQDEADAIETWQDSKPDVELELEARRGSGRWGGKGFGWGRGVMVISDEKLEALVEKGVLSQSDSDALQDWYDGRPDAIAKLMPSRDDSHKRGGRGNGKFGRWGHKWGDADDA